MRFQSGRRLGDVEARGKEMAGVESVAGPRAQAGRYLAQDRADLFRRPADGHSRAGRILHQHSGASRNRLQCAGDRLRHAADRRITISSRRRAGMKAGRTDAEGRGALELLLQPRRGAPPLRLVVARRVEYIGGVRHHVRRFDSGFRQRRPEAGDPLRPDRGLVAVVLGDRREELQRLHAAPAGAERGHVDAARVDGMGADQSRHDRRDTPEIRLAVGTGPCPLPRAALPAHPAAVRVPPAEEEPGRHDVSRLELLMHQRERGAQVGQHRPGELIDQERAVRVEHIVRGAQNPLAHLRGHGAVRNARDHVVGVFQFAGRRGWSRRPPPSLRPRAGDGRGHCGGDSARSRGSSRSSPARRPAVAAAGSPR